MIEIEVLRRIDDPESLDMNRVPTALLNSIRETMQAYPTVKNDTDYRSFDRLFENLYNCRVEYAPGEILPSKVVWPDDRDYTVFLLRWG